MSLPLLIVAIWVLGESALLLGAFLWTWVDDARQVRRRSRVEL